MDKHKNNHDKIWKLLYIALYLQPKYFIKIFYGDNFTL